MKELKEAIQLQRKYDGMKLEDVISEFEAHTGQRVRKDALDGFRFSGLSNTDLLTSDFLNHFGIKNILQVELLEQ